ncbi:hypothetical protein C8R44DRAFT_752873 [Mycena epipterygia]|nr:hypothetical protein C8R44DRAFT_752873 [Mycena epipterygia]
MSSGVSGPDPPPTCRAGELLGLCGMANGQLDHAIRSNQAAVHSMKSEYAEARHIHVELARNVFVQQSSYDLALALLNIGEIDMWCGAQEDHVYQSFDKAKMLFSSIQLKSGLIYCDIVLADLKLREGDFVATRDIFQKYLQWSWTRHGEVSLYCLERMANIKIWRTCDFHWTSTCAAVYAAYASKTHENLALHNALCFLGDVLLSDALEGFMYMDVHHSRVDCMLRLGDIAKSQGNHAKAAALWTEARPLFERSQQMKNVTQIDSQLATIEEQHEKAIASLSSVNVPTNLVEPSIGEGSTLEVNDGISGDGKKMGP